MGKRDPDRFYAALNLRPSATATEIRLAYKLIKADYKKGRKPRNVGLVQRAYETLGDPERRRRYDGALQTTEAGRRPVGGGRGLLRSRAVLGVVGALFLTSLGIAIGPALTARFTSFDVGQRLVWRETGQPLGHVVGFEREHPFEEAPAADAYEVRLTGDVTQWFPASELHRDCRVR